MTRCELAWDDSIMTITVDDEHMPSVDAMKLQLECVLRGLGYSEVSLKEGLE